MKGRVVALCLGLLLLTELGLRTVGRGPWHSFEDLADLPTMSRPDATRGWTNRPGTYRYARPHGEVVVTIDREGRRGNPRADGRRVLLLGGSFVFGFDLDESDAVHRRLQHEREDLSVHNHAVPGYGTLQSTMALEGVDLDGSTVIYGLVELHEARNVAAPSWLRALDRASAQQAWTGVPSAHWDGKQLRHEPPRRYAHWPLSERVALVDATERAWVALGDWGTAHKAETTVRLVVALRDQVERAGGRFLVAALELPTQEAYYRRQLAEERVDLLELPVDGRLSDGHPDAATHGAWARILAEAL